MDGKGWGGRQGGESEQRVMLTVQFIFFTEDIKQEMLAMLLMVVIFVLFLNLI